MPNKITSERIYASVPPHAFEHLKKCARENGYLKPNNTPNVTGFVSNLLLLFVNVNKSEDAGKNSTIEAVNRKLNSSQE